jgi:hypothetical protein
MDDPNNFDFLFQKMKFINFKIESKFQEFQLFRSTIPNFIKHGIVVLQTCTKVVESIVFTIVSNDQPPNGRQY